jgi:hypothetical protein
VIEMLTNYWYEIQKAICDKSTFQGKSFNGKNDDRYTINGNENYQSYVAKFVKLDLGTKYADHNTDYSPVVVVGASNIPETKEDYTLDDLTPQFTHMSNVYSCGITENGIEHTFVRVLKNETSENIIVKEIGLIRQAMTTFTYNAYPFLVMRKVLENEIVVPVGSSITITIVIGENTENATIS